MDDAYLKILEVDQKGLVPLFDKDLLDYEIVVSSSVLNLKVNAVTSDKGASFSIKSKLITLLLGILNYRKKIC